MCQLLDLTRNKKKIPKTSFFHQEKSLLLFRDVASATASERLRCVVLDMYFAGKQIRKKTVENRKTEKLFFQNK